MRWGVSNKSLDECLETNSGDRVYLGAISCRIRGSLMLAATCWHAGDDGSAKNCFYAGQKRGRKSALPLSSAFVDRWRCAFSERHLNALIAVLFGGLRQPLR